MDNADLLARADALVINAGYSAVSEAFVLRKPVFVVPVPGHAEQFVNACLVKDLGLGFMAVELASIQLMTLFLGHPTYALTVILLGILLFAGLGSAAG